VGSAGDELEIQVRTAAFSFLADQTRIHGEILPWKTLLEGFTFDGQRVPLLSQQGIFKPRLLRFPISIRTAPPSERGDPYEDLILEDRSVAYCYRGVDPDHAENRGLRDLMERHLPLAYFYGEARGQYRCIWPVYVLREVPSLKQFIVINDDEMALLEPTTQTEATALSKRYAMRSQRVRLHQQLFSSRVLAAYRVKCAVCHLKQRRLLDGAHILSDVHPRGDPVVPNGIALCKIHHAAFDQQLMGIRPDRVVEIHPSVMEEEDGPMLRHGLQGFHQEPLWVPKQERLQPDRSRLEERYEEFRRAC
jgi:putative restriction endonuclease